MSVLEEIKPEISLESMTVKQALTLVGHTIRASWNEKDIMFRRVDGTRKHKADKEQNWGCPCINLMKKQ